MEETRKSTVIRDLIIKIFLILLFVFLITILFPMPNLTAFYDSVFNENIFWIELKNIDFSKDQPIKKLTLTDNEYFTKNVANKFKAVEKDLQFLLSE